MICCKCVHLDGVLLLEGVMNRCRSAIGRRTLRYDNIICNAPCSVLVICFVSTFCYGVVLYISQSFSGTIGQDWSHDFIELLLAS